MRELVAQMETPEYDHDPWTPPPALADCTVAIVTTAGLLAPGDDAFSAGAEGDTSFRLLDATERNLRVGHWSPNFDRAGIAADLNVAYPIDRLHELAGDGAIRRVAPRHASVVGNQYDTLETMRLDTARAIARLLRDDGVDVALLTPV